jgi:hypothetical protein
VGEEMFVLMPLPGHIRYLPPPGGRCYSIPQRRVGLFETWRAVSGLLTSRHVVESFSPGKPGSATAVPNHRPEKTSERD